MSIQIEFTQAMFRLADRIASESGGTFYPLELRGRLESDGGLVTARHYINQPVSEGLLRLAQMKRLDMSLEAMIDKTPHFHELFTPTELEICKRRATDV